MLNKVCATGSVAGPLSPLISSYGLLETEEALVHCLKDTTAGFPFGRNSFSAFSAKPNFRNRSEQFEQYELSCLLEQSGGISVYSLTVAV